MRFAAFAWLLLAAAPPVWSQTAGAAAGASSGFIDRCVESIDEDVIGLEALESACPGLEEALLDTGYLYFLSPAQREELSSGPLVELQEIVERYAGQPGSAAVEVSALGPILASLEQQRLAERPQTRWERFRKWVRDIMERQEGEPESWLTRWLDELEISTGISRVISYGSIILVLGLALAVLINELRVAGVLRRRRAGEIVDVAHGAPGSARVRATDPDAAPGEHVPQLLRVLVATLVRTGRLRAERSLTHRELGRRASFDDLDQRECFQRVAELAERVVYGDREPAPGEFEDIVRAGRALNAKLGGAAT